MNDVMTGHFVKWHYSLERKYAKNKFYFFQNQNINSLIEDNYPISEVCFSGFESIYEGIERFNKFAGPTQHIWAEIAANWVGIEIWILTQMGIFYKWEVK